VLFMVIAAIERDDDKAFMLNLYNDYYVLVRKTVYDITHDVLCRRSYKRCFYQAN
jgi:RNA polymerase sigma-70 factor (ECF subfamily)